MSEFHVSSIESTNTTSFLFLFFPFFCAGSCTFFFFLRITAGSCTSPGEATVLKASLVSKKLRIECWLSFKREQQSPSALLQVALRRRMVRWADDDGHESQCTQLSHHGLCQLEVSRSFPIWSRKARQGISRGKGKHSTSRNACSERFGVEIKANRFTNSSRVASLFLKRKDGSARDAVASL